MNLTSELGEGNITMTTTGAIVNTSFPDNITTFEEDSPIWHQFLNTVSSVLMIFNLVILMLGMGSATNWREVIANLKRPWGCLLGMSCQFLFLPATGFGISLLLQLPPYQSLGILIISCSPGGAVSNFFTYWVDGDLALSIVMTTVSSIVAFGAMPFNFWLYSSRLIEGEHDYDVVVPYKNILISMAFVTIPGTIGMTFRHFKKKWANVLAKICAVVGWFGILVSGILLAILYWPQLFQIELKMYLMSAVMPSIGIIFSFLFAKIVCFSYKVSRTIAIETGCQNVVVAVSVMMLSFPEPEIRRQIIMFPILYGLFQILQVFLLIIIFQVYKFLHRDDVTEEAVKMVTDTTLLTHVAMPTKNEMVIGAGNTSSLKKEVIEKEECPLQESQVVALVDQSKRNRLHRRVSMGSHSSRTSQETTDYQPYHQTRHKHEPPDRFTNFLYLPSDQESVYQSIASSDTDSNYDNDEGDTLRRKGKKYNKFYSCSDELYLSNKDMEQFYEVPHPNDDIIIPANRPIMPANRPVLSQRPLTNRGTYTSRAARQNYAVENSSGRNGKEEIYNNVSEIDTPGNFMRENASAGNARVYNDLNYIRTDGDSPERMERDAYFTRNINQDVDEKEQNAISIDKIPRSPSLNKGYQFATFTSKRNFQDRDYN